MKYILLCVLLAGCGGNDENVSKIIAESCRADNGKLTLELYVNDFGFHTLVTRCEYPQKEIAK